MKGLVKNLYKSSVLFAVLFIYIIVQSIWWLTSIWKQFELYLPEDDLKGKKLMLIGEGVVFLLIISLGHIIIYRTLKKELALSDQQKNFLMSITHELKTPISSIKLYLQTLKKRDLDEVKKDLIITNSINDADRLNQIVENILIATKIDDQQLNISKEQIELKPFFENLISQLQTSVGQNSKIHLHVNEETTINADLFSMNSIFTNIIENGIKYSEKGADINITLKENANQIEVEVSDNGKGINNDDLDLIFDKFYRSGSESTRNTKGTGLGLFIVKHLVLLHNGSISVRQNSPKGAIFTVQLPKL